MRRLASLCLLLSAIVFPLAGPLAAADHWTKFTSGPYEVLTGAGERPGRDALIRLEEFRHAIGEIAGEQDLQTALPVRVLIFKNSSGWTSSGADPIIMGRDRYALVLDEKSPVTPAIYSALTGLFLKSNTAQMPPAFEKGLAEFFSTFSLKGIHITVGTPPPHPDLDWARIHLLVAGPAYFGKIRVLLFNLRKGIAEDPAYRNAFGKSAAEVEAQVKQHFAAGNFQPTTISSLPLSEKDFPEKQISDTDIRLARADLLAGKQSAEEYKSLIRDQVKIPEAQEGLGILALREHNNDEARARFAAAIQANTTSARCYIEYAKLEPDNQKANDALLKAAGINPKLDEPFALMAQRDTDPARRIMHWKAAAERNPRNPAYWQSLAECYLAEHNYADAAKAWTQGSQAATDPATRDRMVQARLSIERQRLDYEAAEKKRRADEEAAEIAKLKQEARDEIHAMESKYAKDPSGSGGQPGEKPVPWWDGPKTDASVHGKLKQVDCIGAPARLVIDTEDEKHVKKTVRLLIPDLTKISVTGAADWKFRCGAQTPRSVSVGYFSKPNAKLLTTGEVATIEFQ